ncbi:Trimethyllysine dioxygenase [Daldinia caldariorum]|uniref:Trimethyllysine dioxygenase n=1 Tax=Daldinia caldariorum TaxID=326644 RepID=UPI002007D6E8|nr:Trimethyllysine dioxygenase [Daldinia caldariorum]KAI1466295.1 Trimethyllysine dioxygenase [Daldinia caldariorum]
MVFGFTTIRSVRHLARYSRTTGIQSNLLSLRHLQARTFATTPEKPLVSSLSGHVKFSYPNNANNLKRSSLPNIWLRDNCRCTSCVHQDTMQRNFNTFDIPQDIEPSQIKADRDGVKIQWSGDGHESFYPWEFLEFYLKSGKRAPEPIELEYFGAKGSRGSQNWPPSLEYGEFSANETEAVGRLTNYIRRNGFAFVTGVPINSAEPTERLLEKITFIRQTHYGGFYDFIPDLALADTAYTNIALGAHTDTTYFTDPAGLQAFHLLSHTDPGSETSPGANLGGQSLLVDGFHAADILRKEDPKSFQVLSQVKLPWHASGNKGITISPDKLYPVLELDEATGKMHRVRWNNDDRGVVPFDSEHSPAEWYKAARKWHDILRRESIEYWFQLKPGNLLVFDNWRVLHGRSAFTGVRRICGGYINRDDFISRWRNTNYPRDEILKRVIG